jgi:hypothetical protein
MFSGELLQLGVEKNMKEESGSNRIGLPFCSGGMK